MEVESLERIVVGVNKFQIEEEDKKEILKVDKTVELSQKEKLMKLREERNNEEVEKALNILKEKPEPMKT